MAQHPTTKTKCLKGISILSHTTCKYKKKLTCLNNHLNRQVITNHPFSNFCNFIQGSNSLIIFVVIDFSRILNHTSPIINVLSPVKYDLVTGKIVFHHCCRHLIWDKILINRTWKAIILICKFRIIRTKTSVKKIFHYFKSPIRKAKLGEKRRTVDSYKTCKIFHSLSKALASLSEVTKWQAI